MSKLLEVDDGYVEYKDVKPDDLISPLANAEYNVSVSNVFVYLAARVGSYDVVLTSMSDGKLRLIIRKAVSNAYISRYIKVKE